MRSKKVFQSFFLTLLFLFEIAPLARASTHYIVNPSLEACKPLTSVQTEWLGKEWQPFLPFVRVCPILGSHANPVLLVVSVWANLYYSDKSGGIVTISMPKPLLFLPKGKQVGIFPMNYPDDPPQELIPTFTNWRHGFPQGIDFLVKSPTASGDQTLPSLIWNKAVGKYQSKQ